MRNFIISLSVFFFAFSGLIIVKTLGISSNNSDYQHTSVKSEQKGLPPESDDMLEKLAKEQADNRALVEKLQATISKLEGELTDKEEESRSPAASEAPAQKTRVLAVLGAGSFRSGQVVMNEELTRSVADLVPDIMASPDYSVRIEGHTDNIPIAASTGKRYTDNMELSFLRAKAVSQILVKDGISPERISVVGYGDTRPVESNETEEGRIKNRRVEVKLVPQGKEF
jgi:flagellar motor protein MotB